MKYEIDTLTKETKDVQFSEDGHIYKVDGVVVPSVTTLVKYLLPNKYAMVNNETLKRAREYGVDVHAKIDEISKRLASGEKVDLDDIKESEVYNLCFLCEKMDLTPINSEEIVILFDEMMNPLTIGRYDLLLQDKDGKFILADIKTTATIDYEAYSLQLNMYRMALEKKKQIKIDKLVVFKLKGYDRKMVEIRKIEDDKLMTSVKKAKKLYECYVALEELRKLGV